MAEWKELQLKEDKYTDADAVAAVLADDAYVKNTGDAMSGSLSTTGNVTANGRMYIIPADNVAAALDMRSTTTGSLYIGSTATFKKYRNNGCWNGDYLGFFGFKGSDTNNNLQYGAYFMAEADAAAAATYVPGRFTFAVMQGDGTFWYPKFNSSKQFNMESGIIKDPKNHAASALSGTKKLVEIDIGGTSYYLEVYPTKA